MGVIRLLLFLALSLLAGCGPLVAELPGPVTPVVVTATPPVSESPPTAPTDPNSSRTAGPSLGASFPRLDRGRPYVYVVDYYSTIRVIDPSTVTIVGELPVGWGALPVFSPDGRRLYVTHYGAGDGDGRGRLEVFDVASGQRLALADGLEMMTYKIWGPPVVAAPGDGARVYLHGRMTFGGGLETCWIYAFGGLSGRLLPLDNILLPSCQVAPLLASADEKTLYLGRWLVDLKRTLPTVRENADLADRAVAQSPDGRWLYALDRNGNVAVWDANARQVVRTFAGVVPAYGSSAYLSESAIQVSQAGTRLYVATDEGDRETHGYKSLAILDAASGREIGRFRPERTFRSFVVGQHEREVYLVLPDEASDGVLEIWSLETGTRRARVTGVGRDAGPVLAPPPL